MFYVVGHSAFHLAHQESLTLKQNKTKTSDVVSLFLVMTGGGAALSKGQRDV